MQHPYNTNITPMFQPSPQIMYSAGQAKELVRLELNDLRDRYGALVGKRKFPSAFIVAVEDEELIG